MAFIRKIKCRNISNRAIREPRLGINEPVEPGEVCEVALTYLLARPSDGFAHAQLNPSVAQMFFGAADCLEPIDEADRLLLGKYHTGNCPEVLKAQSEYSDEKWAASEQIRPR